MGLRLDYDKIDKYRPQFEEYEGLIPIYLMTFIKNYKYISNLKKNNIFHGKVQEEIFERRRYTQFLSDEELIEFGETELKEWLKKNPQYNDVIIDG